MAPEHWDSYVFNLVDLSPNSARKRFRQSIKDAWGCCAYCGRNKTDDGKELSLTLDHVRPRSRGGNTLRSNLIPACCRCNQSKGSERDWHGWYQGQRFYCQERAARIWAWLQPGADCEELESLATQQQTLTDWHHEGTAGDGLGGGLRGLAA